MIKVELLKNFGAVEKKADKGQLLFREGDTAKFYYQIIDGAIKMNNYTKDGQETIQGLFRAGDSFGEPPLFGNFPYPANAEILESAQLVCLEKHRFIQLINKHTDIGMHLLQTLSKRLHFKAVLSKEVKAHEAEHRILTLLQYLKQNEGRTAPYQVNLTRQVIANMTGLRVETVIRAIKRLNQKGLIEIRDRKLFL